MRQVFGLGIASVTLYKKSIEYLGMENSNNL